MMVADQDVPLGHCLGVPGGLHRAAVDDARPFALAAEGVGAGVERVVQDLHHAVVGGCPPLDPTNDAVAPDHGQLKGGVADPKEDLPGTAELLELGKDEPDHLLNPLVRIELDPVVLAPDQTRRQREAERATVGLGVTCSKAPLAQKAELVLGHRSLQAEQQPVIHQARVVDPIRIDDQGAGQRAEIDQMMPVTPVARQPRRFDAEHRADGTGAEFGDQALEARARHEAGARAAKVVVDHGHGREAGGARGIGEGVLTLLAFEVAEDLRHRRLPDVDDGAARQMVSCDLSAHRRAARCLWSASACLWPPAAVRRAPRGALPRAAPSAAGSGPARRSGSAGTAMVGDVGTPATSSDAGYPEDDPVRRRAGTFWRTETSFSRASSATRGGPISIPAQASGSHIQRGSSRRRPGRSSTRTMSKRPRRAPSRTRSRRPNSGCQRYSTVAKTGWYAE